MKCKHEEGYYTLFKVHPKWRGRYIFTKNGDLSSNTEMFDNLIAKNFKTKYCIECNKKIYETK